jgi:hypothetical protein
VAIAGVEWFSKPPKADPMSDIERTSISAAADFEPPLTKASRRLLKLAIATPRPCPWGLNCICLTLPERRALRRIVKIARQWKRQVRREAREWAQAPLEASED